MELIDGKSRPYTDEKIVNVLRNIHDLKEGFEANNLDLPKKAKGIMVTLISVTMIEKSSIEPDLSFRQEDDESIAGEFSSLLAYPTDVLETNSKEGRINKFQFAFTKHMHELIEMYGNGEIKDSDELIVSILRAIDNGLGGANSKFATVSLRNRNCRKFSF